MALVEKFTNSNVQWLEEMAKFAEVAPPANQLMVTAINAQAALPGPGTASNLRGGTLTVTGVTVDQDLLGGIETKLGAAGITVERGKVTQESTRAPYVWAFNQKLQVPPISKQQLIAKKPVESTDEVSEPAAESTAKPASVATPAAPKDQCLHRNHRRHRQHLQHKLHLRFSQHLQQSLLLNSRVKISLQIKHPALKHPAPSRLLRHHNRRPHNDTT